MTIDALKRLNAPMPVLDAALRVATGTGDSPLAAYARYVMGWEDEAGTPAHHGGKRIRPLLCLFASRALGGTDNEAMPGAVAVELVHNFSLVHDEVQDHDAERHGRPTLWARIGEAQSINAGDYIYTRAIRALSDGHGPLDRRMASLSVLNYAIERMVEGQYRDISFEERDDVDVEEYLAMVAGKTGALLAAPLEIGALLAGAPAARAAILGRWGEQVGLAFQAQDDYLGTWGDPEVTGKSNTNDIARKKKSLPIILGLQDREARFEIAEVYAAAVVSTDGIERVVSALNAIGAAGACRDEAARHAAAAESLLDSLELPGPTRSDFQAIAGFLVNRSS